jgi:hypothetical protein
MNSQLLEKMDKIAIVAYFKLVFHIVILTITEIPITRQYTMFMRRDCIWWLTHVKQE